MFHWIISNISKKKGCVILKNTYVSDYWNKGIKGHENYDFVDINVSEDNLLFIDPILIEITKGEWFYKAKEIIVSYFDNLYKAYR